MQQITSRRGKGAGRQKDMGLFTKMFGTRSEREVKKLSATVDKVMALEEPYKKLSDDELRAKTKEFKTRLAGGETLDDLLPEAFAAIREAASRVLGMRPYRVQVVGGIVLHQGRIAEMKTGEGKTLVAILPAYLNALDRRGRSHRHRQRLPCQARLRVDGQGLPLPGAVGGSDRPRPDPCRARAPPMPRTSPTAPTTSWASTTCATTWRSIKRKWSSADMPLPSSTRSTPFSSTKRRTPLIISGKGEESSKLYEMADYLCLPAAKSRSSPPPTTRSFRTSTTATTSSTKRTAPSSLTPGGHQKGRGVLRRGEPGRCGKRHALAPHQSGHEGPRAS